MRVLAHHPDQEMSGVFLSRLDLGLPFGQRWNDEGLVPPSVIPGTCVGYFSVTLLPQLRFFAAAHQGENGARHHRNVSAADDLEQAQRVRYLFIAPLVSA